MEVPKSALRTIEFISTENLLFDAENPRFAPLIEGMNQDDLAKTLWDEMFLDELILSLAVNGYYIQEPLLVVPHDNGKDYIVIEGNRRLASVKILTDPKLAKKVKASNLPEISNERVEELKKLPVIAYSSRSDLWSYLSFRHVNGPRGWSSISKAEFVADIYLNKNIPFEQILRSTGDRNKTSIKMFNGLMVLRQGETETRFTREDFNAARFNFSHLYTIIQYPNTKKYLGIDELDSLSPFGTKPVPQENLKALEELLLWIFGSKKEKKIPLVKSQNPDLKTLDDILGNNKAIVMLQESASLYIASDYTEQEDRRLRQYVTKAFLAMQNATGIADSFRGDTEVIEDLEKIKDYAEKMLIKMSSN